MTAPLELPQADGEAAAGAVSAGVSPRPQPTTEQAFLIEVEHLPAAPLRKEQSRYTAQQVIDAYKATGSVWRAGKLLGLAGQSVHERLRALGYPIAGRKWSQAEDDELRRLVEAGMSLSECAHRLGRPYNGVALRVSRSGLRVAVKRHKKLPRGAGLDKVSINRHLTAIEKYDGKFTQYARANGLSVEVLAQACEKHFPERWRAYVADRSDLPSRECAYCEQPFIPSSTKQRFCTRKCGQDARADAGYFGGKRKNTIGLAEGICQLCNRVTESNLTPHHVLGKENDPENDSLIALCRGCHRLVGDLGGRAFIDDPAALEALISLAWLRRHGPDIASGAVDPNGSLYVYVEIDQAPADDDLEAVPVA